MLNKNEVERTAILLTLRSLTPWHGRHEKCPTHNYGPALWLITPLVCHFCVQKEKNRKEEKKFFQHKHCTQKLALVQTWYNCASFESFIFRKLSQKSLPICLQNLKFFICRPLKNPNVKGYYVFHRNISISCKNDGGFHLYLSKLAFSNQF